MPGLMADPHATKVWAAFCQRFGVLESMAAWRLPWNARSKGSKRLGPVTRLFDLPAPEQTLRVQDFGPQCGNEIDGRGTRPRP